MKVILDTNVIYSAMFSSNGASARIFEMSINEEVELFYNDSIIDEYREVLERRFNSDDVSAVIEAIKEIGISCTRYVYEREFTSPDSDDRIFYEAAMLANAYLITWNLKHYPNESFILNPKDFLKLFE